MSIIYVTASAYEQFNTMQHTLTWHNYSDHLREALREMMISSEFADVTLVTDDKQQIRAHRNMEYHMLSQLHYIYQTNPSADVI